MGDGGTIPNFGQKQLNLVGSAEGPKLQSIFQIAAVTRPLMSVGRICDKGHTVMFDQTKAVVNSQSGRKLCEFMRNPGRLYVAKITLKSPTDFDVQA